MNPPSLVSLDSIAANRLDKMEGLLTEIVNIIKSMTSRPARNEEDEDYDQDDESQSSLNRLHMRNSFNGAQS